MASYKIMPTISTDKLNVIYNALKSDDLSECVMVALKVLEESDSFVRVQKQEKCNVRSFILFARGKDAMAQGKFQTALKEFNAALMLAPLNSKEMVMSYSGRAQLLFETEQFSACLKDIETCFEIECSDDIDDITKNLRKLENEARQNIPKEKGTFKYSSFEDNFFNIPKRNSDVPCLTADMQVIIGAQQPTVVAARDIPVGTVLAKDTAFVSVLNQDYEYNACHYCHKLCLNLIPCDKCCFVLFCDKHCKEESIQNGHDIECKIMNFLTEANIKYTAPVRAVIKMRKQCESWSEFIIATQYIGHEKLKNNSADIFGRDKFSLLYSYKERHFIHGAMFNACIINANSIHCLDQMTGFLPRNPDERSAAIRALCRTLMYLTVYCPPLITKQNAHIINNSSAEILNVPNLHYFPFVGKLNHSCVPNTYLVTMGNSCALVAAMPIKKGSQLTISYINHWIEERRECLDIHAEKLFALTKIVCDCPICSNDKILYNQPIKEHQKAAFLNFVMNNNSIRTLPMSLCLIYTCNSHKQTEYGNICKILELLYDVPYSEEYVIVFEMFIANLIRVSVYNFRNILL